jgi:hypothetical protein
MDFGSVAAGSSADGSFTVTNLGGSTAIGTVSTAAPFSVVSGASFSLDPGASQTVVVRFNPSAAGAFGAAVTFTWNGGADSRIVTGTTPANDPKS